MSRRRIGLISLFSFTALLSLTAALGAVTSYTFVGKVLPRTLVAGVEIGGLSFTSAQEKVQLRAGELSDVKLAFTLNDKSANISLNELGVKMDEQSTLSQAVRPDNYFDWLKLKYWRSMFKTKELALSYDADPLVVRKKVETILGVTTANTLILTSRNSYLV